MFDTEVNRQWINSVLQDLYDRSSRFRSFIAIRSQDDFYSAKNQLMKMGNTSYYLDCGATKAVIIDDSNKDFVIKIPFSGLEEDYCEKEVEHYEAAQEYNVPGLFAAIEYIEEWRGAPIYLQEYIRGIGAEAEFKTLDSIESSRNSDYYYGEDDEAIYDAIEIQYSLETFDNFRSLVDDYGINDFHFGNVGYRDGRIVFVDYSGYFE